MTSSDKVRQLWDARKHAILLMGIILLGTTLRLYHVDWGLPYRFHVDEHQYVVDTTLAYWRGIVYEGELNPHLSTYGTLPLYTLILTRLAIIVPDALIQGLPITSEYLTAEHASITYVAGRTVSALLSAASIYLFYVIGQRLYNRRVGLLTAALVATTVALIQAAHYYTVDSMLIFFLALAFIQAINMLQQGNLRSYRLAGVMLALALAVKLPALFLVPVLFTAHLFNAAAPVWQGRIERGLIARFFDRRLIQMGLIAFAVYALLSPYSILDFQELYFSGGNLNAARNVKLAFFEDYQTWTLAYYGLTPYLYEVTTLLFFGMGVVAEAASLLGVVFLGRRFEKADRLLLAWVVPFFLVIGINRVKTIRYILPLIPFLAPFAAVWLDSLFHRRWPRSLSRLPVLITSLVLGFSLIYSLGFTRLYGQTDSRVQAADWLYQNAAPGSTVVVEDEFTYTAQLGVPDEEVESWNRAVVDPEHADDRVSTFDVRVLFSPYYASYETADADVKAAHIRDTLAGADYIVVSERHYQPYSRLPDYRPVEHRYYQQLFNGELDFRLVTVFDPSPEFLGIIFNDDSAELYSKVFDHPKIWIFAHTSKVQHGNQSP